ncbi:hypothetical protein K402DRAFT_329278 [Aulographum hederae CBS 113979]|uniref:LsmAD domain-containing protein n=1 Tax=Aulographum hederae CBS 113979 TaxID=1176131 RepID=A0A6G1H4P2_9PEZI|nr:hypothetical protein K402DRAFT_329278 [Aulographum hederae CBS 113979]
MSNTPDSSTTYRTHTPNPPANAPGAAKKSQLKMSSGSKTQDAAARKQPTSPVEQGQRKPSVKNPSAWAQGNPITQRPSIPPTQNGVSSAPKSTNSLRPMAAWGKETSGLERHANDRMTFLLASCTGLPCSITLKNGDRFKGLFSASTLDTVPVSRYVLKMVKEVKQEDTSQANGVSNDDGDYIGAGENHVMTFEVQNVVDLEVNGVSTGKTLAKSQNGASSFRTDTDISGNQTMRERTLQKWEPGADTDVDLSLEGSGTGGWDQFATNERLTGLRSDYDENLYTTTINTSAPGYSQKAARAARLAREIEGSSAMNEHVAEERGGYKHLDDSGLDEEEKYSGVRRDFPPLSSGQPNKYTPPGRRPPTGQPSVPGVPYDPAIISSQIARPDSKLKTQSLETSKPADAIPTAKATPADAASTPIVTPSATAMPNANTGPPTHTASPTTATATAPSPQRNSGQGDNATETVEKDVLNSFKQFAATEKMRASALRQGKLRAEKDVKLNDLKKFAENFKLNSATPEDLIPILAKDKKKQDEIREKARKAAEDAEKTPPKPVPAPAPVEPKTSRTGSRAENGPVSPLAMNERVQHQQQRGRPSQGSYQPMGRGDRDRHGAHASIGNSMAGRNPLGPRLTQNMSGHRAHNQQQHPMPHELRIPPTGPALNGAGSPTSSISTKFNVQAMEFKPNAGAAPFNAPASAHTAGATGPTIPTQTPSPSIGINSRPQSRRQSTVPFFEGKKPMSPSQRLSIQTAFNPITRMTKEVNGDEKLTKLYANNHGIPEGFRTAPTWETTPENSEKTYHDLFTQPNANMNPGPPPQAAVSNGQMPHQHQLPFHLQGPQVVSQQHTPHQTPRHMPAQPHHGHGNQHHFDDHRMLFSASASSVQPSPRAMPQHMVYQPQPGQMFPQTMQGMPPNGYMVGPNGQPMSMRPMQGFMPGQPMGGHMMTNQPSNGPFMNVPVHGQPQMYSPGPGHVYPNQHAGLNGPYQAPNGYPSPRAPMMSHQGSQQGYQQGQMMFPQQQGHGPPMFGQAPPGGPMTPMRGPFPQPHHPQYNSSPHQQHHFPQQQHHQSRGTPSGSYAQPMMPQHSMQGAQGGPPGQMLADGGDEAK